VVVLTHVCEALHLFPWMHFGLEPCGLVPLLKTAVTWMGRGIGP
jgi:hypothetical protein